MSQAPRQSGIGVALFSLASSRSWGIGEFADLPAFASWCQAAGQRFVQLLPLHEISPSETSPYSSMTAMALDPLYIHVPDVQDFAALGGEAALPDEDRALLGALRVEARVRYADVRALKLRWLARAYARFRDVEMVHGTPRAQAFQAYSQREGWWLDSYTTFRVIHAAEQERAWWDWPSSLAYADPEALRQAVAALADERQYRAYLQWIAEAQWQAARVAAAVYVFGDLPFMVSGDSPDVWARKDEFMLDATVGVPPDAFSDTGQDWGLPPWRWDVMEATGFHWMRARARRTAALFDGVRIDHLVGLYRIYVRPTDDARPNFFSPPDQSSASLLGAKLLGIYLESGMTVVAEDLGTVPDFVRSSMAQLGVPGFKVMRWERSWQEPGQPLIDPGAYPEMSVALSGTHDTESLAQWWRQLPAAERAVWLALPAMGGDLAVDAQFAPDVRDALLRALLGA
ncbi:MAG TPA: 4-alpha-glucanotransferase, partial [Vicinamibacterales bacterium]|nr:4-alpha-glucanotransferase [Vicinamibacterales bacterium]